MVVLIFKNVKRLATILWIPLLLAAATDAAPVIFIVRHAEKASASDKDPDLSLEEQKRADALARILKRFADYVRVRYGIQAHAGNCGTNSESRPRQSGSGSVKG